MKPEPLCVGSFHPISTVMATKMKFPAVVVTRLFVVVGILVVSVELQNHGIVNAWSLNTNNFNNLPRHLTRYHHGPSRRSRRRLGRPQERPVPSSSSSPPSLSSSATDRGDQDAPVLIREELGCSPTLSVISKFFAKLNSNLATPPSSSSSGGAATDYYPGTSSSFFFDPLNLATDENFAAYREAELKHCRVACLAVVGSVGVTYYKDKEVKHILGEVWKQWFASSSFLQQSPQESSQTQSQDNSVIDAIVSKSGTSSSSSGSDENVQLLEQLRHLPLPQPLHLLQDWTVGDFARMIFVCGVMETLVWVQIDPQAMPGDYGIGYFGVRDKGSNERSLIAELENGRLCMVVMLYYVIFGDIWQYYTDFTAASNVV